MKRSLTARIVVPFLLLSGAAYALIVWSAATSARRAVEERALQQAREISRLLAKSGFLLNSGMLGHVKSAADADIVDVSFGAPRGSTLSREDTERVAKAADPQRPFAEAGRYRVVAIREGETSLVFAWEAEKLEAAKSAATRPLLMLAAGAFLCVLALGVLVGRASRLSGRFRGRREEAHDDEPDRGEGGHREEPEEGPPVVRAEVDRDRCEGDGRGEEPEHAVATTIVFDVVF